jgi:hypothetical protein
MVDVLGRVEVASVVQRHNLLSDHDVKSQSSMVNLEKRVTVRLQIMPEKFRKLTRMWKGNR